MPKDKKEKEEKDGDKDGAEDKDEKAEQKGGPGGGAPPPRRSPPRRPPALKALVAELLPRLTARCFQKNWQSVVGGVAGIDALSRVLPISALRAHLAKILQALLRALRSLRPHAVAEVAAAPRSVPPRARDRDPRGHADYAARTPPGVEAAVASSPRNSSARLRA